MSDRPNPRQLREIQARYAYDVRNKGVKAAVDGVFERNAAKRANEKRAAKDAAMSHMSDNVGKEIEDRRRGAVYFAPK